MDEKLINEIISIAIHIAIDVYEEKKKDFLNEQKEQNIQTIKDILKKYKIMKAYLHFNQDTLNDLEKTDTELSTRISEIMKGFDRTLFILKYVYEKMGQPEDMRCYQIIEDLYLSEELVDKQRYLRGEDKVSMIAKKYNINKRTVYKDISKICNMLSLLYFGILD